jgi:hypothetical protein
MLLHDGLFKKFNYKDDKPRAVVPASATADELQEIVSQGIWGNDAFLILKIIFILVHGIKKSYFCFSICLNLFSDSLT